MRAGVGVSLASMATYGLSQILPPEIMPDAQVLVTVGIAAALATLGKMARQHGYAIGEIV